MTKNEIITIMENLIADFKLYLNATHPKAKGAITKKINLVEKTKPKTNASPYNRSICPFLKENKIKKEQNTHKPFTKRSPPLTISYIDPTDKIEAANNVAKASVELFVVFFINHAVQSNQKKV